MESSLTEGRDPSMHTENDSEDVNSGESSDNANLNQELDQEEDNASNLLEQLGQEEENCLENIE